MATFIVLGNWTEKGAKEFADAPARSKANDAAAKAMGGRIVATYWTMGQFDFVTIVETPSDEAMAAGTLAAGAAGTSRAVTMRAFDVSEMEAIVATVKAATGG